MSNEAAERLDNLVEVYVKPALRNHMKQGVAAALAAERRATVERIRAALLGPDAPVDALYERHTRAILDAESQR